MELYPGYLEDHFNLLKHSSDYMTSTSTQFPTSIKMGIYERQQIFMWNEAFKIDNVQVASMPTVMEAEARLDNKLNNIAQEALAPAQKLDQGKTKSGEKVIRRLAQNREAARKSRLRKKAYIQQLESSRIKLAQLEQELERTRNQGFYVGNSLGESSIGFSGTDNTGNVAFDMEYARWVEDQCKLNDDLRVALQAHVSDLELSMLVENTMVLYAKLFQIKSTAIRSDVFYIMSGMWKTAAERFFLWIGGFRPSEILKILTPQLDPLTEKQYVSVCNLQQTSRQAEDALVHGMEKLQQTLAETLTSYSLFAEDHSSYMEHMANALVKLEPLISLVDQADSLRHQTLQQMYKILTIRQAARGLLALGNYFERLRALSSLWAARPREQT